MSVEGRPSVLLTGGTGFLGSRLARLLLDEGFAVTVLARPDSRLDQLDRAGATARVRIVRGDPDMHGLAATVAGACPEIVIHVAAISRASESVDDARRMIAANITFPTLLLATMRDAGVSRFVNTGTSWQTAAEGGGYSPFNLYAGTKQAFEDVLACFCATGLAAITLRLFDTYGPGDERRKVVDLMAEAAERAAPLAMSPGEQVIDLVHVDDVARAYLVAARRLLRGEVVGHEVYGVSGERLTLRALAARIGEATGTPPPIEWGGRPYRPREIMRPWSGFARLPGWAPRIGLRDGLREVARDRARRRVGAATA